MNAKPSSRSSKPPKSNLPKRKRRGRRGRGGSKATGKHALIPAAPKGQASVAAAYASGQRTRAPRVTTDRDSIRVIHRELVSSVTGTPAFAVAASFPLNPGMSTTFPWLSVQAQAWERYRFNSLKFEYYTRTGSNTPGSVMLVPDYDPADLAPATEQVASSYQDVTEDAPWKDMACFLKPASLHALGPSKFVRSASLDPNLDIKTYDSGNLFLCTVDGTAVPWGKLWVEYDVTLMTPQLHPSGTTSMSAMHIIGNTPSTASFLGTQTVFPGSQTVATVVGNVMTFDQAGSFLITVITTALAGGSVAITTAPTQGAGLAFRTILGNPGNSAAGSGLEMLIQVMAVDTPIGGTITFGNTIATGASTDLLVVRFPAELGF
jgi:hypothetical protein